MTSPYRQPENRSGAEHSDGYAFKSAYRSPRERDVYSGEEHKTPQPPAGVLRAWCISGLVYGALILATSAAIAVLWPFVHWHGRAGAHLVVDVPIAALFIAGGLWALRGEDRGRRLMIWGCVSALSVTLLFNLYDAVAPLARPDFYSASEWASRNQAGFVYDVVESLYVVVLLAVLMVSRNKRAWH